MAKSFTEAQLNPDDVVAGRSEPTQTTYESGVTMSFFAKPIGSGVAPILHRSISVGRIVTSHGGIGTPSGLRDESSHRFPAFVTDAH